MSSPSRHSSSFSPWSGPTFANATIDALAAASGNFPPSAPASLEPSSAPPLGADDLAALVRIAEEARDYFKRIADNTSAATIALAAP